MKNSSVTLYDYSNRNSQRLHLQGCNYLSNNVKELGNCLIKDANRLMNTVMDIEMGTKTNCEFLPSFEFKNGILKIGDFFEMRVQIIKNFWGVPNFGDLRTTKGKLLFLIETCNHIARYKQNIYNTEIENITLCKIEDLACAYQIEL